MNPMNHKNISILSKHIDPLTLNEEAQPYDNVRGSPTVFALGDFH